jgi:hypothetical protein
MKNKSRPAVARKSVEQTTPKNVMIVDTPDGPLEIDLSDMPELSEISEDEIPDDFHCSAVESYGNELVRSWMNEYPGYIDDESFPGYHSLLDCYHYAIFDELLSSNIVAALQSLSQLFKSCSVDPRLIEIYLFDKFIEERENLEWYESHGLKKFRVSNTTALKRTLALLELVKPNPRTWELVNEEGCLLWAHDFSDFCEILSLMCDAKSFGEKDPVHVFRVFKRIIRFKTSATEGSFSATSSNNRKRTTDPLYFYHLLKKKYYEAEKKREDEYGERDTKRSRKSK